MVDPVLFGDQNIEPTQDSNPDGSAQAFPFTDQIAGNTVSIGVYVDTQNQAKTLIAGIYSSRNGHPYHLLASGSLTSPKAGAWNTVTVGSAGVKSGSTYWVTLLGTQGSLYFRDQIYGNCFSENSAQSNLSSLPSSWTSGPHWTSCPVSAYVDGLVPAGGGTVSAPSNTGLPQVNGTATQGQALSTSNGSWSGSPTSYGYAWQDCDSSGNNCTTISGASAATYTLTSNDVGHTVRSRVTATNAAGSTSATSAASSVVAAPPSSPTSPPTAAFVFSPTSPVTGSAVSFDGTSSTCAAAPCTYTWDDDGGAPATGSWPLGTGAAMQFTFQQAGTKYVRLTVQDAAGRTATVEHNVVVSSATTPPPPPPTPSAPANTGLPQISGTASQGQTLNTSNGTWSGSPNSYSYAWQDCDSSGGACSNITGAAASSYTLTSGDVGQTVRAVVTATNSAGSTNATSAASAVVSASSSGSQTCTSTISSGLAAAISSASAGSTICLNAANYGSISVTTTKTSMVTIMPASGVAASQAVLGNVNVASSSNLTFTGLTVGSGVAQSNIGNYMGASASHIHFSHDVFLGPLCINVNHGAPNEDILIDHNSFNNLPAGCQEGRVNVQGDGTDGYNAGVVISNNIFDGSNAGNGCSDGVHLAVSPGAVQIGPGNQFTNLQQNPTSGPGPGSCTAHVDSIQYYGGGGANKIINNYFYNDSELLITNSTGGDTISQNLFRNAPQNHTAWSTPRNTFTHNTWANNAGFDVNCDSGDGQPVNTAIRDNIITQGYIETTTYCGSTPTDTSTWVVTFDLGSGFTQTGDLNSGQPTYVGGSVPSTCAGYQLASASVGHNAASDGTDMGVTQWTTTCNPTAGP